MSRREFLLLSAGVIAGAALAACTAGSPATPTTASKPTAGAGSKEAASPASGKPAGSPAASRPSLRKIAVGAVSPPWTIQIVTLIPVVKGFFKDEGFADAEYKVLSPATNVAAVVSGEVDFADCVGSEEAMRVAAKGEDMAILGGRVNKNTMAFVGAKGLKSMADIKGKTIGAAAPGSKTDIVTRAALTYAKLEPGKDVLLVPAGSTNEAQGQLEAGRIQGAVFISSQLPVLKGEGYPVLLDMSDVYKDYQSNVMVTMGKLIAKEPEVVQGYVNAMLRTYRYMQDKKNWPEIKQIALDRKLQMDEKYFDETMELIVSAIPASGEVNKNGMNVVLGMEKDGGTIDKSFDPAKMYHPEFMDKALKS